MHDAARLRRQLRRRHAPVLRCRAHEHRSSGGTHLSHRQPIHRRRHAAAGELPEVLLVVEVGLLDLDALPIGVQFLSDEHRKHRLDALADLWVLGHDRHGAVRSDAEVGTRHGSGVQTELGRDVCRLPIKTHKHSAASQRGDFQERSTADRLRFSFHVSCPLRPGGLRPRRPPFRRRSRGPFAPLRSGGRALGAPQFIWRRSERTLWARCRVLRRGGSPGECEGTSRSGTDCQSSPC